MSMAVHSFLDMVFIFSFLTLVLPLETRLLYNLPYLSMLMVLAHISSSILLVNYVLNATLLTSVDIIVCATFLIRRLPSPIVLLNDTLFLPSHAATSSWTVAKGDRRDTSK